MAELPEDIVKTLERYRNPPNKLRSLQEINARYKLTLENYKKICLTSGDVRDQKIATHAEIKILGWVLGKPDKDVIKDIAENSNRVVFPPQ
ncbi:MAG: hypothetical protein II968_01375 [Selenomonadaceae bacterium]|nr:hypothetical protein [Selenomonadaceae bacterium]MBQ4494397.1 hypothetical protein [Selenomonadaceae bacterium]MBR0103622.1 hypothetical protein [Selenomonadaceae bacterium]